MPKFEAYNIDLKNLSEGAHSFEYELDDAYFTKIDSPEVQRGQLTAQVSIDAHRDFFEVRYSVDGKIILPCDRCLDDMEQLIKNSDAMQVKLGADYSNDGDVMIVPETDGTLNMAWFFYELIVLAIPLKHVHPSGQCNKTMMSKLRSHAASQLDDDDMDYIDADDEGSEDKTTDPRWDGLKDILDN